VFYQQTDSSGEKLTEGLDPMALANFAHFSFGFQTIFDTAIKINRSLMSVMAFSYSGILAWVSMIGDFAFSIVLYFSITLYLVQSEHSFLDFALGFVPNGGNLQTGLKLLI